MLEFYDTIEKKVKRHRPEEYIPYCAQRLSEFHRDVDKISKIPPHNLLHSIEANCAYYKSGYDDQVTWKSFAQIMNLYQDYGDNPFLSYTISENIDRLFLMMARQQFELQNKPSRVHMARVWSLFVENPYTITLAEQFERVFGISFKQWLHLSFLSWVAAHENPTRIFKRDILLGCDFYKVTSQLADLFYSHVSYSIKQIKNNFLNIRNEEESAFHFLIRSVFLEKPIIAFDDGNMIAPAPDLIFLHSGEGLLDLVRTIPDSDSSIAKSFEYYIGTVLNCLNNKICVIPSNQLEDIVRRSTGGKVCDFIIETDSEILLIECKATTYTAKMFTDNAILNNSSTGKIANGLVQLYTTAHYLDNGVFDTLSIDNDKPAVGIIVTFGEIPLVSSDWYFKKFVMERAERRLSPPIFPSNKMTFQPIVMSVETFENMITILNNTSTSIINLSDAKENEGYAAVGDWNTYLRSQVNSEYQGLSIITDNNRNFFESMGVDMDRLEWD